MTEPCTKEKEIGVLETRLLAHCEKNDIQFQAIEKAITTAKDVLDFRLNGMNDIRKQLTDQAKQLASKADIEKLDFRVSILEKAAGKQEGSSIWVNYLITVGVAAVVSYVLFKLRG